MTTPDPKSAARRRRTMRAVNVPMRAVLSLPFPTPLGRSSPGGQIHWYANDISAAPLVKERFSDAP